MKPLFENENVEFKESYTENIKKEVIAFANSSGGTIYVGIADDGCVVGLENVNATLDQLTSAIRDSIKPDITMFINYNILAKDDKQYIVIEVQKGTDAPYYLAAKGLRPSGVYVRQGSSSVPASDSAIRRMIKETDGDLFEDMRSLNQELSFEYTAKIFEQRGIPFGYIQMKNLGMIIDDTVFSNLALLFSDQCPHIIKAATFKGTNQEEFQDRKEFTGSILKQLDDAYDYLERRNCLHGSYRKLVRIDTLDYPELSLREALLNAIIHRDYAFVAPTIIGVYDDRIEFISVGGLLAGISFNAIMVGLSVCRNPKIANVFYRLHLIEAYGTGMRKIMSGYEDFSVKPEILTPDGAFKVTLPNVNFVRSIINTGVKDDKEPISVNLDELLKEKPIFTRKDVEEKYHISLSSATRIIRQSLEDGVIVAIGNGKNRKYQRCT